MKNRSIKINKADQRNIDTETATEKPTVGTDEKVENRKITNNINSWIQDYRREKDRFDTNARNSFSY